MRVRSPPSAQFIGTQLKNSTFECCFLIVSACNCLCSNLFRVKVLLTRRARGIFNLNTTPHVRSNPNRPNAFTSLRRNQNKKISLLISSFSAPVFVFLKKEKIFLFWFSVRTSQSWCSRQRK